MLQWVTAKLNKSNGKYHLTHNQRDISFYPNYATLKACDLVVGELYHFALNSNTPTQKVKVILPHAHTLNKPLTVRLINAEPNKLIFYSDHGKLVVNTAHELKNPPMLTGSLSFELAKDYVKLNYNLSLETEVEVLEKRKDNCVLVRIKSQKQIVHHRKALPLPKDKAKARLTLKQDFVDKKPILRLYLDAWCAPPITNQDNVKLVVAKITKNKVDDYQAYAMVALKKQPHIQHKVAIGKPFGEHVVSSDLSQKPLEVIGKIVNGQIIITQWFSTTDKVVHLDTKISPTKSPNQFTAKAQYQGLNLSANIRSSKFKDGIINAVLMSYRIKNNDIYPLIDLCEEEYQDIQPQQFFVGEHRDYNVTLSLAENALPVVKVQRQSLFRHGLYCLPTAMAFYATLRYTKVKNTKDGKIYDQAHIETIQDDFSKDYVEFPVFLLSNTNLWYVIADMLKGKPYEAFLNSFSLLGIKYSDQSMRICVVSVALARRLSCAIKSTDDETELKIFQLHDITTINDLPLLQIIDAQHDLNGVSQFEVIREISVEQDLCLTQPKNKVCTPKNISDRLKNQLIFAQQNNLAITAHCRNKHTYFEIAKVISMEPL